MKRENDRRPTNPPDNLNSIVLPRSSDSPDAPDDYKAFGVANFYGEVISMLRLRFSDDSWRAFPYYGLSGMSYDPALGIELQFHSTIVRLRGRNLFPLFTLLGDHGVRWCWEGSRHVCLQMAESEPLIEAIELRLAKGRDPVS
jgi:hypothetical protein